MDTSLYAISMLRIISTLNSSSPNTYDKFLDMNIIVSPSTDFSGVSFGVLNSYLIFKFAGDSYISGSLNCNY